MVGKKNWGIVQIIRGGGTKRNKEKNWGQIGYGLGATKRNKKLEKLGLSEN